MKPIRMSNEDFTLGYNDGTLGLYFIEKVTDNRFITWSAKGKKYLGSNFNGTTTLMEVTC